MAGPALLSTLVALALAPVLPGLVSRTKALFAGRQGPPLLQLYFDLAKLLRKGAVYSATTTWLFRAGPMVSLACVLAALALVPALGYVEGLAVPLLGVRLRQRAAKRYAGLRTLAK